MRISHLIAPLTAAAIVGADRLAKPPTPTF